MNLKATVNKTVIISIIVVVALLLLVGLWWLGPSFAGKAIGTYGPDIGGAGIFAPSSISANIPVSLLVGANLDNGNTVAIGFNLTLPTGLSCDGVTVIPLLNWDETVEKQQLLLLGERNCSNNVISFAYATMNYSDTRNGTIDIANITFTKGISQEGRYEFKFDSFEAVNFSDDFANLIKGYPGKGLPAHVLTVGTCPNDAINPPTCNICSSGYGISSTGQCVKYFTGTGEIGITLTRATDYLQATNFVNNATEYKIAISITPLQHLSKDHTVITTVSYNGTQEVQYWTKRPQVRVNETEYITFTHQVKQKNGPLTVKVMVWKDFLSSTLPWEDLMDYAEINYEIK
ncbi:MAG: hypothetical protein WCV90_07500 [Candidatus Woesearchaeota archaeon]